MLFAVCADRGAPGSTTAVLALAAARGLPVVVVEADPYGGDLALRVRLNGKDPLPTTPTVLSVSAGRSAQQAPERPSGGMPPTVEPGRSHRDLWRDGSHQLNDLVRIVPGFMAAEHGTSMAWPVLASALEAQSVPVFADLGRIHVGSPSMPIATAADAVITVCRGDMASVQHMVDRLEALVPAIAERNGRPPLVLPVVVAPRQHGARIAASVAEILGETGVGPALRGVSWLAWDPAAVNLLEHGADPWAKPLKKSALMRSAHKAMRMLGLATGLEHAEPGTGKRITDPEPEASSAGVPAADQQPRRTRRGSAWTNHGPAAAEAWSPATHEATSDRAPAQLGAAPRPTAPPPTWTPGNQTQQPQPRSDTVDAGITGGTSAADARRRWESPTREQRH